MLKREVEQSALQSRVASRRGLVMSLAQASTSPTRQQQSVEEVARYSKGSKVIEEHAKLTDQPAKTALKDAQKENLLICNICMNRYDTSSRLPLTLMCGHSFCKVCATSIFKSNRFKCPFDNQSFSQYHSVDNLGKNFTVLELLEQEKRKQSISDVKLCQIHQNKKVKFFCKNDSVFACSECLLSDHLGHEVTPARPLILGGLVKDTVE